MPSKPLSELETMVGDSVETVTGLTVEAGKVAEFANALRDSRRLFRDEETATRAGYRTVPAPLTFTRVGYFPQYRPEGIGRDLGFDVGFAPERVVHGSQAYRFERPVYVGETLSGMTTLVDVFQRERSNGARLTFAVLETEFRTTGGESVLTATNTRIETGDTDDGGSDTRTDGGSGDGSDGSRRADARSRGTTPGGSGRDKVSPDGGEAPRLRETEPGDSAPVLTIPDIERKDFVKYAGASGDFNRIHYDEPYARAAGHDTVIGQGMLTAGYASRMAIDWFGLGAVREFSTRFRSPLHPGDVLTVSGTATDVSVSPPEKTVEAEYEVTKQDGTTVATGGITAVGSVE